MVKKIFNAREVEMEQHLNANYIKIDENRKF